ncbi:MAG TPA: hypothetical protein VIV06_08990 [Candidatus Limnocylindrales bacterium]
MPDPNVVPPVVAESGDPFAAIRVLELLSRIERGRAARLDDLVHELNRMYLDWLFNRRVVADVVIQLQSNWMADYRNGSGVVLDEGPAGPTVTLEDSSRLDPWLVHQAQRAAATCRAALVEFSRRDGVGSG